MRFIEGQESPFMRAYNDKGRVNQVLETVPLFAVLVEDLGVRGALKSAQIEYEKFVGGSGGSGHKKKHFGMDVLVLAHMVSAAVVGVVLGMALAKRK
jgi:Glucokinase